MRELLIMVIERSDHLVVLGGIPGLRDRSMHIIRKKTSNSLNTLTELTIWITV